MDKRSLLIELLEDFPNFQNNNDKTRKILVELCINASKTELEEFTNELSQLLCSSPDDYLLSMQAFFSFLYNDSSCVTTRLKTWLPDFALMTINNIILPNLQHSDIHSFGLILYYCIELLWRARNDKFYTNLTLQTLKRVFRTILTVYGALQILISSPPGHHCFKRVLFDFNLINQIEKDEMLKAVDIIAALIEKCYKHKEVSSQLSEGFSIYKACTALLKTLETHYNSKLTTKKNLLAPTLQNMVKLEKKEYRTKHGNEKQNDTANNSINSDINLTFLSTRDEQHLNLLGMKFPQKLSHLPNFLKELEQRKINTFQNLIGFMPCISCHERALISLYPEKYKNSLNVEQEDSSMVSKQLLCLPFEFNKDDKLGSWDILLSEYAIRDIQILEFSYGIKVTEEAMKKLWQISSGKWKKHDLIYKVSSSHNIPVYEVKVPGNNGLRIIWQIDHGFSVRSLLFSQHVKIWAITDNQEQINLILEKLKIVHQVYNARHKRRCEFQQMSKNRVILPRCFSDELETKFIDNDPEVDDENDEKLLEVHKILITNKFFPLSKNLIRSLVLNGPNFTFQVSKKEYEIINYPTSAIIIGRSGTGKTTSLMFRQISSYQINQLSKTSTLNEAVVLAGKTAAEYNEYVRTREETDDIEEKDDMILEEDDEEEELSEIPDSFRLLKDNHFPLFITYKKFSRMLQGTYGIDVSKLTKQKKHDAKDNDLYNNEDEEFHHRSSILNLSNASWHHFINYNLFQKKYWPRFNNHYKKKLNCEQVFSEFAVIKGTNPDVEFLSREDYRVISTKKYPLFQNNRDEIYNLFERYEKMKSRNGDYDSIDRTQAISRYIKMKALVGPHIHEVYIDEFQDNKIVDLALILKLFEKADSIFMAGDIAQCIAEGSSFQFRGMYHLRSLMYNWELNRIQPIYNPPKPKKFHLNTNYRSHNGILRLAASIIDLILQFFPNSIDRLNREHGEIGGPRPVIFEGFQIETEHKSAPKVIELDINELGAIELGARQVIIVRDKKTKDRLKTYKLGLVLTIYEAKGMEFDDVLLYNFFTDSEAGRKWRVILSTVSGYSKGVQTFSPEEHYILCSELKNLYVAVTRSRQHLYIFDENFEYSNAMQTYWKYKNLVKVRPSRKLDTFFSLAKKSSPHEWCLQGKIFFEQRQYEQAIFCFEKSGNERLRKLADAYNKQEIARDSVNDSDDYVIKYNFVSAAKAFIDCSRSAKAALCYKDIGMWKEAGDNFTKAKKYNEAILAYKEEKNGKLYPIIIDLMKSHANEIDKKIFRRITRLINIHYRNNNDNEMSKKALSILPTQEDQIELLKDHAPEELLEVYKKKGQFSDAAKYLRSLGKFKQAFVMLSNHLDKKDNFIDSLCCLLHLCRVNILADTMSNKGTLKELGELLNHAKDIDTKVKLQSLKESKEWYGSMEEFQLYSAYLERDLNRVHKYIQFYQKRNDTIVEFRALNIWLKIPPQSFINTEYWHERLQHLMRLCELAYDFIDPRENVHNQEEINKNFEELFFVEEVQDRPDKRKISSDNPIICHIVDEMSEGLEDWQVYNVNIVHKAISMFLASHIYELISKADQEGRNIPDITSEICYENVNCKKYYCRKHHVIPTPSILRNRITLACLQYTVMRQLDTIYRRRLLFKEENSKSVLPKQRYWAERLVDAHFRYQSPHSSCPEITHAEIIKLPRHTYNGLEELSYKVWLDKDFNPSDFEQMLKYIFVLLQLRCSWGIDKFHWEIKKKEKSYYNSNYKIGFENTGRYFLTVQAVAKRLALFVEYIRSNQVIMAIGHSKKFIDYSLHYSEEVNIIKSEAFSDLTSLLEFTMFLILAARPGYCDFCLPRSYLVNYYESFNLNPRLICLNSENKYNKNNYDQAIKGLYYQAENILNIITNDYRKMQYTTIILRLIRLLTLICLNESGFTSFVLDLFKSLRNQLRNKYLLVTNRGQLVDILNNDLKENGFDSLVIVYNWGGMSRFSSLVKPGITMISYHDPNEFSSSLQKITTKETVEPNFPNDQLSFQPAEQADGTQDTAIAWFREIHDSPQAQEAAIKIQTWFRRIQKRQSQYDPTLDKIYKEVKLFCQNATKKEESNKMHKYSVLLMGPTVYTIVELFKLQDRMDKTLNKLKKIINNRSSEDSKIDYCLELEDELKSTHYENVESTLKSLSTTENSEQHKEANIEWLENELEQANNNIDLVWEWIEKCNEVN
ncbi:11648_t:CDS:10 [Diversispora eburnea]|uniref:11648_t:CDS:1 n=1 Tax=Diversispora eburnea TaxID=1213867 RepID=A0A9N8ZVT5_9GLOM|nr:11648_t:CDS:10 [Diversispora eburnea]